MPAKNLNFTSKSYIYFQTTNAVLSNSPNPLFILVKWNILFEMDMLKQPAGKVVYIIIILWQYGNGIYQMFINKGSYWLTLTLPHPEALLENNTRPLVFTSASGCRACENFDISSGIFFFHLGQYFLWCRASAYFKIHRGQQRCSLDHVLHWEMQAARNIGFHLRQLQWDCRERSGSVVECEGLRVRASPASLCCVLEQEH